MKDAKNYLSSCKYYNQIDIGFNSYIIKKNLKNKKNYDNNI